MTALAASATLNGQVNIITSTFGRRAKATKVFYGGALVCLDTGRFLVPAVGTVGHVCCGVVDLNDKESVDTTGTTDGDVNIKVRTGVFPLKFGASTDALTKADELNDVYVLDDQTVGRTDGGVGRPIAGQLWKIGDADGTPNASGTVAWVSVGGPRLSNSGASVGKGSYEEVSVAGALSVLTEFSLLTLATGAQAFTLANGKYKGQRKVVTCVGIAGSPVGTVTPATPIGFATVTAIGAVGDSAAFTWNGAAWMLEPCFGCTFT